MPLPFFKHKIKNKVTQSNTTGLKPRPRGDKRARVDILKIKSEIVKLADNYNDHEIIDILRLNRQTYYRLKGELYQEAKEIWAQTYKTSQELRILHTINAIHLSIRVNKEIATDKDIEPKIRLEAAEALVETEMKFLQLLHDINDSNKTPQEETELYSKPEWYDESKEKIWDSMMIQEKKDRIWKEKNK